MLNEESTYLESERARLAAVYEQNRNLFSTRESEEFELHLYRIIPHNIDCATHWNTEETRKLYVKYALDQIVRIEEVLEEKGIDLN